MLAVSFAAVAAPASTPAEQSVSSPTAAGEVTEITWSGTIPVSSNPQSDCDDPAANGVDRHAIDLAVPEGLYEGMRVTAVFEITWTSSSGNPRTSDLILTVIDPSIERGDDSGEEEGRSRQVGNANFIGTRETVRADNLRPTRYEALVCGFVNSAPQPYDGKLTLTAESVDGEADLPSADARGLAFSASTVADPQRREIEPIIEIDPAGVTYTCGPAGVPGVDYIQVALKGGDQFHLLGEPPQGRPNPLSEGGDCGLATGFTPDEEGRYPFAFTGLGPLTNFPTAASVDNGRTLRPGNSNNAVPGVDRQWMTFVDDDTVLLSYNRQQPRQIVVQRSTDGGQTYSPVQVPASPILPRFPGPMRSLPAEFNPTGAANGRVAYFAFDDNDRNINLAVSFDEGATWTNCRAARSPGVGTFFPVADHDRAGNIYVGYGENSRFHMYVTALKGSLLDECDVPVTAETQEPPPKNPGFTTPVQVDRDGIRSTVFPWLAAGGAPGRVAMSFYGTPTDGNPNQGDFKATWHVYVNQSLNLLDENGEENPDATFSQVQATSHPFHYDSICLNGTLCSATRGDRALADFFSIDHNPVTNRLQIAYSQSYKRPDETGGVAAAPTVVLVQRRGPGNAGGRAEPDERPPERQVTEDDAGDAIREYSTVAPTPKDSRNEPAVDFRSVRVDPSGDGGLRVTMKLSDLSNAALAKTLRGGEPQSTAQSLLWVFRWVNGFRPAAASARWSPAGGFTFGFNDFAAAGAPECSPDFTCQVYRGNQPITGSVDQAAGTIVLEVPRAKLKALEGPTGPGQRPKEVQAGDGARLYDAMAWSMGNTQSATQERQGLMMPFDNTSGMDLVLAPPPVPQQTQTQTQTPPITEPGGPLGPPLVVAPSRQGPVACQADAGFRSVSARPRGSGLRLSFERRSSSRVAIDVFQQTRGRRILGERLVARFRDRTGAVTWNGRARGRRPVSDGYFFARFSTVGARAPADVRRVTLRRVNGRFSLRRPFHRRASCGLLRLFKLSRPVFGGRTRRTLGMAFSVEATARVTVTIRRGSRVVRRFRTRTLAGRRLARLALPVSAAGVRGDHTVELVAVRGTQRVRAVLVSRRL